MSKSVSVNYTDTAIPEVESLSFTRGLVNFGSDFRVKKLVTDGELVLTNLSSPVTFPEKFRYSVSPVNNVYTNSGLEPSVYAPTKRGVSILCQLTENWSVTDTEDPTYIIGLPVSAHVVLKIPEHPMITPAMVQTLLGRLISGLYETGDTGTDRLTALLRGSLTPKDL